MECTLAGDAPVDLTVKMWHFMANVIGIGISNSITWRMFQTKLHIVTSASSLQLYTILVHNVDGLVN